MEINDKEKVAIWRYGIIAPVLMGQELNQHEYFSRLAAQKHNVPYYGIKDYSPKTFTAWLSEYRRFGIDGLKPCSRSDIGKSRALSPELEETILNYRRENMMLPCTLFFQQLLSSGVISALDASYPTVYRLLKRNDLVKALRHLSHERKRFSVEFVNQLWQADTSDGIYLTIDGKKLNTYLFAFIDDCSRLVPYAAFYFSEKTESLCETFKQALLRHGIPKMLYVDNGKIYQSSVLQLACASLNIVLTHTKPYDPEAKGKIERFFGTVKKCFFPLLRQTPVNTIEELNERFHTWLNEDYNRKLHSSIGMTPMEAYMAQTQNIRLLDDPKRLYDMFLKRTHRKVKHDGTISVSNQLYEVPASFVGKRVEIRHDEEDVYIYENDKRVCRVSLVNFVDNSKMKRQPISFAGMEGNTNV